jgi:C-terminal processing protease CtpA/Prc
VIALMNGGSASTTSEFLSNLHYNRRATFVGEEAGGGYYGNTSGPTIRVTLSNTKVRLLVPLRTYYLAVKDGIPNRSVLPDYEVKASIDDLVSGRDVVMIRALERAKRN